MGDIIGIGMIAALFIGLFVLVCILDGVKAALVSFGATLFILLWVSAACYMPELIELCSKYGIYGG